MDDLLIKSLISPIITQLRDKYYAPIGKFPVQEKERRWRLSSAMQKSFRPALSVLGDLLFWAEVGLLSRRRAASKPSYGYRASERCLHVCTRRANIPDQAVPDLIRLLRDAIPALNDARLRVVKP